MIDPSTRSTLMFFAMTPPGSTDSRTVPSWGPPTLQKYHQGIPFCAVTTTVDVPHSPLMSAATPATWCAFRPMMTRSWTPSSDILSVARTGKVRSVPPSWRRRPFSRIAARCCPRTTTPTSWPIAASFAAISPPIAPAPTTQIFMSRAEAQLLCQADPLELPGGALGDLGQEHHLPRDFEMGQVRGAEGVELSLGRRRPFPQHDRGRHLLAELVVWHAEGEHLGHRRMRREHVIHLQRGKLLAAAVDLLLEPTGETEVALLVEDPLVAGPEPAVPEGGRVGLGIRLVAGGDVGPADGDLAHLPARQHLPFLVEDHHLRSRCQAHRAGLACPRGEGIGGHLVGGLGHPVALDHRDAPGLLHIQHHRRGERLRGGANEPQPAPGDHLAV